MKDQHCHRWSRRVNYLIPKARISGVRDPCDLVRSVSSWSQTTGKWWACCNLSPFQSESGSRSWHALFQIYQSLRGWFPPPYMLTDVLKWRTSSPLTKEISAEKYALLFTDHVVKLQGLSEIIISDGDVKFVSKLWDDSSLTLEGIWHSVRLSSSKQMVN